MTIQFRRATRARTYLRLALCGPAGSGKSYTGLRVATGLLDPGQRLAVVDTEHGSAELYADAPNPDGGQFDFDVVRLDLAHGKFSADNYIAALSAAKKAGYPVVLVDSLSHAWAGEGGILDQVDNSAAKSARGGEGNKFAAWRGGTKSQNELVDALLSYPGHVVCTLRSKVEFVLEEVNGKKVPRKVGMATVQRDGVDYEFTVVGDLDVDTHRLVVTKSRCSAIADRTFARPGRDLALELKRWLDEGSSAEPPPKAGGEREKGRGGEREDDHLRDGMTRDDSDDPEDDPGDRAGATGSRREEAAAPPRPTDAQIAERLERAGLTRDEADWYSVTYSKAGVPLAKLGDEELARGLGWLTSAQGVERVRTQVNEVRKAFQAAWFAKWTLMYPEPRKKDGATDEQIAQAEEVSTKARRDLFRAWYGVESVHEISIRTLLKGERGLEWVRHVPPNEFESAVRS